MIQANTLAKLVTIATLTWTLSATRSGQQEPFAGIKRSYRGNSYTSK
jgi:hypothetical protein